ncbi:RNA polymerase sigma factor [Fibrella forsythiae]|uniref:RNA polymerase sigma factor n=1 Tax=Fibrella forsythiae TaxID=2817061 RepID=A0ABS3JT10_9BACT|nr:sigma-70 family RNA polymerase sigma factor [Fibrella forsythiae]MBO0953149.1 sigma-70 family RNA polymerase sigma factor [Fibrella forsythiae]
MRTEYREETLVSLIQQGDQAIFSYLYKRYHRALLKVITQLLKEPDQAEDVLQDTYVKIWLRFQQYDASQGTLATWLYTIARNTVLDALRQRRITYASVGADLKAIPALIQAGQAIDAIELARVVRQHLNPQQWQLIRLAYWQGYTHREIAQHLALPMGTVKTRLLKSLLQLRPIFR